jgi:hypothetical protein
VADILILWYKNVEKILFLINRVKLMKKNILSIIILSLMVACPAFSSHHGHVDIHEHGHKNDEESKKIITDDNEYLTNLNLMKGHLWVGIQLYKASFKDNAKMHMKHPKSELYGGMIATFKHKGAPGFASELETLASSVENEEPLQTIDKNYKNLFKAINENEKFVDETSISIHKKVNLVISLLKIAEEEYAIGIVNGKVKNKHEYQDALGFTTMAKNIIEGINIEGETQKNRLSAIIAAIETLSSLWPELAPNHNVDGDAKSILNVIEEIKNIAQSDT